MKATFSWTFRTTETGPKLQLRSGANQGTRARDLESVFWLLAMYFLFGSDIEHLASVSGGVVCLRLHHDI